MRASTIPILLVIFVISVTCVFSQDIHPIDFSDAKSWEDIARITLSFLITAIVGVCVSVVNKMVVGELRVRIEFLKPKKAPYKQRKKMPQAGTNSEA